MLELLFKMLKDSPANRPYGSDPHQQYKTSLVEPLNALFFDDSFDAVHDPMRLVVVLHHDLDPIEGLHDEDLRPASKEPIYKVGEVLDTDAHK